MIPFLKKRHESGTAGPVETQKREPDNEKPELTMSKAIAHDLMDAVTKKDLTLLEATIDALISHIQDEDEVQDQSLTNKE